MTKNVTTGITGLDEMLNGGFPEGRVILIVGGPGTGKTVLASQFLHMGINDYNENGVFVSVDESKAHYYEEMQNFGWDFKKAEEEKKFVFVDATRMPRSELQKEKIFGEPSTLRAKQLPINRLVEKIEDNIQQIGAKRVVLDTLGTLFHRFPDSVERRIAIVDLVESLSELGTTTLVTTELGRLGVNRELSVEEYMAHGVIVMQTMFSEGTMSRALQVEKMRGTKINPNCVPYTIDKNGVQIFPDVPLFGRT